MRNVYTELMKNVLLEMVRVRYFPSNPQNCMPLHRTNFAGFVAMQIAYIIVQHLCVYLYYDTGNCHVVMKTTKMNIPTQVYATRNFIILT